MRCSLRLLGCLLFLCSLPAAYAGQPEWIEIVSPHFSVVTDAGERRGRDAALHFEQMRAAFGALLNKAKVSLPVPLQIVAFRNTKEMRQFVPLWQGKPVQMAGLFQGGEDRTFILLDMSAEDPWHVVFHEYAHQLLHGNISVPMQPWFDEGFAEFFSTIETTNKAANIGKPIDSSAYILQQGRMMRVEDLFRVQQNSSIYNESGDHRSMFYAESWLVVHYIFDKQLILKVMKYYELMLGGNTSVADAIQQAFGMSPANFDKALQGYLNDNRYRYFTVPLPPGIDSSTYISHRLSDLDARAVLADSHLHSPDYHQQAAGEFEEILKQQPGNLTALRGLGYSCMMNRDYDCARDKFSRAVELDSNDPRSLYYAAILAQREGFSKIPIAKTEQQLEKAISLAPDFADAYNILAFVYLSEKKQQPAIDAMLKAVQLNPGRSDYSLNLARVYLSAGKTDDGIHLLAELCNSSQPWIATTASRELAIAQNAHQAEVDAKAMLQAPESAASSNPSSQGSPAAAGPGSPVKFLKGRLLAVDCSSPPAAVLNVSAQNKVWKFKARDLKHMIVIGADELSCSAANQPVAVNFRQTGEAAGDLVSLEIQ